MRYLIFLMFFTGCAGLKGITPKEGTAAGIGAGGAIVVDKIKEHVIPKTQLSLIPSEVCFATDDLEKVVCQVFPCLEDCVKEYDLVWFLENKQFTTVEVSQEQVKEVDKFCKDRKDVCNKIIGKYEGDTVVFSTK